MNGFIANTDPDWYAVLRARQRSADPSGEVNFWKPSEAPFRALRPGEPLLFRLKSPDNAIGGVGFYETWSPLPVWLAWETFGTANGVTSLAAFEERLRAIRERNQIDTSGELRIGCILLAGATFFAPDEWVRLPDDWKVKTVSGKGYDLSLGEGARVWNDCLDRLRHGRPDLVADEPGPRFGAGMWVRPRLGQAGFRIAVMDAYQRSCAVTTEHSLPVLEAAHIRPYGEDGEHDVTNGLLLRTDIHRLFDRGYVTVTPDYRFRVSERLRSDYANGKTYYALRDRPILLPHDERSLPSREALAWHGTNVFLG